MKKLLKRLQKYLNRRKLPSVVSRTFYTNTQSDYYTVTKSYSVARTITGGGSPSKGIR